MFRRGHDRASQVREEISHAQRRDDEQGHGDAGDTEQQAAQVAPRPVAAGLPRPPQRYDAEAEQEQARGNGQQARVVVT